jgi:hypothetical protein
MNAFLEKRPAGSGINNWNGISKLHPGMMSRKPFAGFSGVLNRLLQAALTPDLPAAYYLFQPHRFVAENSAVHQPRAPSIFV